MAGLEEKLTPNWLKRLTFRSNEVVLSLPKYRLRTDYDLVKPLAALGLNRVFSGGADLAG